MLEMEGKMFRWREGRVICVYGCFFFFFAVSSFVMLLLFGALWFGIIMVHLHFLRCFYEWLFVWIWRN